MLAERGLVIKRIARVLADGIIKLWSDLPSYAEIRKVLRLDAHTVLLTEHGARLEYRLQGVPSSLGLYRDWSMNSEA